MAERRLAYTVAAVAVAGLGALVIAPYWLVDVSALAFGSMIISYYCLRNIELPSWLWVRQPQVRSRVFSYAQAEKAREAREARGKSTVEKGGIFSATELRDLPEYELSELEAGIRKEG